jgi:O-antigen ligase/polysaccharide polymerase Wzy-like membrane protein
MLAWPAMGTAPEPEVEASDPDDEWPVPVVEAPATAALVLTGLAGAVLGAAVFAGDGSDDGGILPVGGAAVVLVAGAFVALALGRLASPRVGRSGGALVVSLLLLVAWTGATIAWSIVPDRSWDAFNRSVSFAAFLVLGIVLAGAAGRFAARLGASMLAAFTGVVLTWALLAKAVPSLDPGGDRIGRLREPVGYWNALALLADIALVLGLWLGTRRFRVSLRIAGGLLVYVATLSLLLTLSRAGVIAGVAVVGLWLALSSERVEGGLLLLAAAGPAVLIAAWAFTRPALVEDGASRSDRVADGTVFGILALVGVAFVLAVVGSRRALGERARHRAGSVLMAGAALAGIAAAVVLVVAFAAAVSGGSSCSEVVNDPSRLSSLDPNNRWCWWNEAWDVFADHAPEGAGAGTFEIARKRYRVDARSVVEPHSVPLQQLSDGGVAAFVFFLALVAAAAATCVCALRRLDGGERAAAAALVAAPAAYLVHALVDYDWDFLAVTAPTMVALGVLAAAGRPAGELRWRVPASVAAVLVALAVLASFTSPWLSERYVRASTRALDEGDIKRAKQDARRARRFNPLAVDPLFARARVAQREGRTFAGAETRYVRAVELQPENPETWYALGLYEFQVRGNMCAAYSFLNEAYTLDPAGNQWVEGGPLDVARDAVNTGACEPG